MQKCIYTRGKFWYYKYIKKSTLFLVWKQKIRTENMKKLPSKARLLKLWEILKRESDENNKLTTSELLEKLNKQGLDCDRRTLYGDVELLNDMGLEVMIERGRHFNKYYVEDRQFDIPELRILMDAVQAANFITEKKTRELLDKIALLAGARKAELLKKNTTEFNTIKHTNEKIYYSVDELTTAINNGKRVKFRYFDLDENKRRVYKRGGEEYHVDPLALIYTQDNYYLYAHDGKKVKTYRIDRMADVLAEQEDAAIKVGAEDAAKYRKEAFSMFDGESKDVAFIFDRDILNVIYDKFGEDIHVLGADDDRLFIKTRVKTSNVFYGWWAMLGIKMYTTYDDIRKGYIDFLLKNLEHAKPQSH